MGGLREDVIESPKTESPKTMTEIQSPQKLRFHESKGEVHFHNDADQLKCSIPVAEWFIAMRSIKILQNWSWVDSLNSTILHLRPNLLLGSDLQTNSFDVEVELKKISLGVVFNSLLNFSKR